MAAGARSGRRVSGLLLVALLAAACGGTGDAKHDDPVEVLRRAATAVAPGRGDGWEALADAAGSADVVFLGEWHGFRENAAAARHLLTMVDVRTLALEVGAEAADEVEAVMISGGVDSLAARWQADPYSVPFLWWREEAALVGEFLGGRRGRGLVGFDREFPWSARFLLRSLEAGAEPPAGGLADSVAVLRVAAEEGFRPFLESGDASTTLLTAGDPWRLDRLAGSAGEAGWADGARRLSRMAHSARLETGLRAGSIHANLERVRLMEGLLTERLPESPVLVKTGLQHAGRRLSFLGYADLGGRMETALGGEATVHVAVVPATGAVNGWLPGQPDSARSTPFDGVARMAGQADLRPFVDAAEPAGPWTLFDLREVRGQGALPPGVEALTDRFDFLILVHRARPATFFAEMAPGA